MAAVPADTDALPLLPLGNTGTEFIDDARDFVSWDTGNTEFRAKRLLS